MSSELKGEVKKYSTIIAGREFSVEFGRIANLTNGTAFCRYGDTVVLTTAVASKKPRLGIDFFPLSVEFEEKLYAVGKIPGGFIKREARPSEKATLSARLIDRPIRPLFPQDYLNDVQITATVMSVDQDCAPEIVAMLGSSIALSVSDIPFSGPTASVIIGYINSEYILNPTVSQQEVSEMHLVVSGTRDAVMMVEAGMNILPEDTVLDAIMFAHEEIKKICDFIQNIADEIGKEKMQVISSEKDELFINGIKSFLVDKVDKAVRIQGKAERNEALEDIKDDLISHFQETHPGEENYLATIFKEVEKELVRKMITYEKVRPDGRKPGEIRPVSCEVGLLPRTHGSGLFTRGLTQALTITTLGALGEAQRIDGLGLEETKRYMHHYNFPPFSVGEVGMNRTNRRAIGHGALAERALVPVIPSENDFPYAIRLVSEVVTCNGSSSQASICGSTLSLLDAGVPIKDSVAGIAMGLIKYNDEMTILTDIQGMEDALGDMDFKVAGTANGITALQMDIKVDGISKEILGSALEQARQGRLFILENMANTISRPRAEMSLYAPRVFKIDIHPDKIREVIGQGGKVINRITAEYNVKIDISDTGRVLITAADGIGGKGALKEIETIVKDIEVGEVYTGKITRIMNFGAFVELLPGKEGMCHISQFTKERLEKIEGHFKVGDEIVVKVIEIDDKNRVNVSRKVLLTDNK